MSRVDEALARARAAGADTGIARDRFVGTEIIPADETPDLWTSEAGAAGVPCELPPLAASDAIDAQNASEDADARSPSRRSMIGAPERLLTAPGLDQGGLEQYRRLGARLHLAQAERGIKILMVASALPGEGKTLTAANLALTLSDSYRRRVLLIDGDLRRPSIHEIFRVANVAGLNDGVNSDAGRKVPLVRWSEHLTLVTAGRPDHDPMKVLSSQRMQRVIAEAGAKFDWVIIDTPPVGLLTDASLFAAMVDTVVLVVQAGRTPFADIQRAIGAVGRERIFGVVLNRVALRGNPGYVDYAYATRAAAH